MLSKYNYLLQGQCRGGFEHIRLIILGIHTKNNNRKKLKRKANRRGGIIIS